jgi:hypothetical protein
MTPKEKMRWFWALGAVPGTMFGDYGRQSSNEHASQHRKEGGWWLPNLWKRQAAEAPHSK